MELKLLRYRHCEDSTGGLLFIDNWFECYICEDEKREVKLSGETRIPEGRYEILLRNEGGMTQRYKKRFPDMHKGMLWLLNVPCFEWVYIHIGNDDDDTEGCLLTGLAPNRSDDEESTVSLSVLAYVRSYEKVVKELLAGERVFITIESI